MQCPFLCGFHTSNDKHAEYHLTAHIELLHTPESQFSIQDDDLRFALALQRDEEQALVDRVEEEPLSDTNPANNVEEGAPIDDDFPYAECPVCEDFVHLFQFDQHMYTHQLLNHSFDTITTNMTEADAINPIEPSRALVHHKPTSSKQQSIPGSATIARTIRPSLENPSGNNNVAITSDGKLRGSRLGVRRTSRPLLPCSLS
jgi:hypothetical protein